jgi:hypothetical protein
MLKRFFLLLAVVIGLQMMPAGFVQAQNPSPPPAENIDSGNFMFDLSPITHEAIEGSTRQSWIRQGINYFFERAIGFMAAVIGGLSVLMLSIGGFLMLSSGGSEQRYEQGKTIAKFALVGLAVTLSAYIMVTLVQLLISSIYG